MKSISASETSAYFFGVFNVAAVWSVVEWQRDEMVRDMWFMLGFVAASVMVAVKFHRAANGAKVRN